MKLRKVFAIAGGMLVTAAIVTGGVFAVREQKIKEYKSKDFSFTDSFTYTSHTGCMGTKDNSLESIAIGVENGAGIVEFDLNFTENGEPVLAHDAPSGGELTLDEAFRKISEYENIRVNVDIKSTAALEKVKPAAEKHGVLERIFFTGVHDGFVEAVRADGGGIPYYLNVDVESERNHSQEYLDSLVQKVKESGAIGINFNKGNASKALVDTFHANNLLVSIWTVDSEPEMYRILSYSPDNITTRNPDKLREIINTIQKQ